MRITPLDIHSHHFGQRLRGLDPEEVQAFLRMIAEDYEELLRNHEAQQERIRRLESRVEQLTADERLLKETLLSAQAMTEDLRKAALKEAKVVLSEAELKAEKVIDASHRRAARLSEEIREMRGLRSRLAESLRTTIDTHLKLIEGLEGDPLQGPGDSNVTYLTPPEVRPEPDESNAGS